MDLSITDILGKSDSIRSLRSEIPKIARSDAPTLISGSTGTGKEHFARAIHFSSDRKDKPFVALNCAAIPDSLFEAELFGFEKGSFTGATLSRDGKAKMADHGTLFLDEIGELSPYSQTKLLRLLEAKEAFPIGASKPLKLDVRIIAATNVDVEEAVADGEFRDDLYYRVNVARIDIPCLADRPEDIAVYVDHFLSRFNRERRKDVSGIDPKLLDVLSNYEWPGNIREVRNFVEGVFIDPPDGLVTVNDIPRAFERLRRSYRFTGRDERARLLAALEKTNWNKAKAAKSLHWSRMTLYRKLTKYHISDSQSKREDGDSDA